MKYAKLFIFMIFITGPLGAQEKENSDLVEKFNEEKKKMIEKAKKDSANIPLDRIDYYSNDLVIILEETAVNDESIKVVPESNQKLIRKKGCKTKKKERKAKK